MDTIDVLKDDLNQRIQNMKNDIASADACLDENDLLQCAVRLQDAAKEASFDTLIMNVYESIDT